MSSDKVQPEEMAAFEPQDVDIEDDEEIDWSDKLIHYRIKELSAGAPLELFFDVLNLMEMKIHPFDQDGNSLPKSQAFIAKWRDLLEEISYKENKNKMTSEIKQ